MIFCLSLSFRVVKANYVDLNKSTVKGIFGVKVDGGIERQKTEVGSLKLFSLGFFIKYPIYVMSLRFYGSRTDKCLKML